MVRFVAIVIGSVLKDYLCKRVHDFWWFPPIMSGNQRKKTFRTCFKRVNYHCFRSNWVQWDQFIYLIARSSRENWSYRYNPIVVITPTKYHKGRTKLVILICLFYCRSTMVYMADNCCSSFGCIHRHKITKLLYAYGCIKLDGNCDNTTFTTEVKTWLDRYIMVGAAVMVISYITLTLPLKKDIIEMKTDNSNCMTSVCEYAIDVG